ncbi:hypothetical protein Q3G72_008218 [Acer saccharum]|nr:hypothetical protein Q3G72_008218 [Acer saccharum]
METGLRPAEIESDVIDSKLFDYDVGLVIDVIRLPLLDLSGCVIKFISRRYGILFFTIVKNTMREYPRERNSHSHEQGNGQRTYKKSGQTYAEVVKEVRGTEPMCMQGNYTTLVQGNNQLSMSWSGSEEVEEWISRCAIGVLKNFVSTDKVNRRLEQGIHIPFYLHWREIHSLDFRINI